MVAWTSLETWTAWSLTAAAAAVATTLILIGMCLDLVRIAQGASPNVLGERRDGNTLPRQ
jgi:hypothetical protein